MKLLVGWILDACFMFWYVYSTFICHCSHATSQNSDVISTSTHSDMTYARHSFQASQDHPTLCPIRDIQILHLGSSGAESRACPDWSPSLGCNVAQPQNDVCRVAVM